ncbi:unnamed protein product [Mycena citricolor]|uniref:Uncharacterized protein n=1 Tax=Mycena citricolor TaxID=2018698 RepID=A0AAD2GUN6_9AGAR|nr:unnamed protein product [Mycena citricolor]
MQPTMNMFPRRIANAKASERELIISRAPARNYTLRLIDPECHSSPSSRDHPFLLRTAYHSCNQSRVYTSHNVECSHYDKRRADVHEHLSTLDVVYHAFDHIVFVQQHQHQHQHQQYHEHQHPADDLRDNSTAHYLDLIGALDGPWWSGCNADVDTDAVADYRACCDELGSRPNAYWVSRVLVRVAFRSSSAWLRRTIRFLVRCAFAVPATGLPAMPIVTHGYHPSKRIHTFFQNKAAVGATFAIVGLIAVGLIFAVITTTLRRKRARAFDREIAEEAKRAPPPVFLDDEDYGAGYSYADPVYGGAAKSVSEGAYPQSSEGAHSNPNGHTPSNYMYPSGYSDLGFSEVSSHGTFAQPAMEAQYGNNNAGGGAGGFAGYGAAGAYEMSGYGQHQQQQPQQDWQQPQQDWQQPQQGGYVYPGEEPQAGTYPQANTYPPAAPSASGSGSGSGSGADLGRSKSGGRSLVDAYASTPGAVPHEPAQTQPQMPVYANGYASQYQTPHLEDSADAYGGVESQHGHVGGLEDEEEDYEPAPRVLKIANE